MIAGLTKTQKHYKLSNIKNSKEVSVKDLIQSQKIAEEQQKIAEEQIELLEQKSSKLFQNNETSSMNSLFDKNNKSENNLLQSELQLKWKIQKQNITNTKNQKEVQDFDQFYQKQQEQQSGFTIIDQETNQKIQANLYFQENVNINSIKKLFNNNFQFHKNDSNSKFLDKNQKKQLIQNYNSIKQKPKKGYSNKKDFIVSPITNAKKLEYCASKDLNLINFFTNKRFYLSSDRKTQKKQCQQQKQTKLTIMRNKNLTHIKNTVNSNQNIFSERIYKSKFDKRNRHTFTNDNQNKKDKLQDSYLSLVKKNNKIKIRPQTVKYGCSYFLSENKENIEPKNDLNNPKMSTLNFNQCQINALINSNINQNKKVAKFMQVNAKFYKKYGDSELTKFINFNKTQIRNQKQLQSKQSYFFDRVNNNLINQNKQNKDLKKVEVSVGVQTNSTKQLQITQQFLRLEDKVQKKLPYLLKMGVNFKLKQKNKGKTKQ